LELLRPPFKTLSNFKGPLPSALALVLFFIVMAYWPAATDLLRYQRQEIANGQLWRLFTGHFVHLGIAHALLNSTGAILLAFFLSRDISVRDWWVITLTAPFVISAGLWLKQPQLISYVGFSGVLHGLLYFGVIRLLPVMPWLAGSVLLLLVSRQVWEQTSAYNPYYLQDFIHGRVMPDAHLWGAVTGSVWALWTLLRDSRLKAPDKAAEPS
jgi:rhomboid family GlyGly-CTERM serine protease